VTITAIIVADSISPDGIRLTTMELRYPRFIHAEFMTHRVFSRNASSSRAIPVAKLIEDVMRDTAMPIHWGKNQPGMQAHEELDSVGRSRARSVWRNARNHAIERAQKMHDLGAHKQIVNRLLEPFSHINVVVTATEWQNFFDLRRHPDAQPEIRALADAMFQAMENSEPKLLKGANAWHLPYIMLSEMHEWVWGDGVTAEDYMREHGFEDGYEILVRLSVARCARVSYMTHEGKHPNFEDDMKLYDRLVGGDPIHASPAEHQARPDVQVYDTGRKWWDWGEPHLHGNFNGWVQNRKEIEDHILAAKAKEVTA